MLWELSPSPEPLHSQVEGTSRGRLGRRQEAASLPPGSRAPSPRVCGNPFTLLSSSLLPRLSPSASRGAEKGANYLAINTSQEELLVPQTWLLFLSASVVCWAVVGGGNLRSNSLYVSRRCPPSPNELNRQSGKKLTAASQTSTKCQAQC